jgi:hypothetical protein
MLLGRGLRPTTMKNMTLTSIMTALVILAVEPALAAPHTSLSSHTPHDAGAKNTLRKRSSSSSFVRCFSVLVNLHMTSIQIPAIVVVAAIAVLSIGAFLRNKFRRAHLARIYSSTNPRPQTVQVTASQLATGRNGNTGGAATTNNSTPGPPNTTNANTGSRSRRARRNRRRASQMSVTSLPLYKEEADDSELVLVR